MRRTARVVLAVAMTSALITGVASASAPVATILMTGSVRVGAIVLQPGTIVAGPTEDGGVISARLSTESSRGMPDQNISNARLSFTAGSATLCIASTDAQGVATCNVDAAGLQAIATSHGYGVTFGGDATYAATSAKGPGIDAYAGTGGHFASVDVNQKGTTEDAQVG